jgi:hypothetical protein
MTTYEIEQKGYTEDEDDQWECATHLFILEHIEYICLCYNTDGKSKGHIKIVTPTLPCSIIFNSNDELLAEYERFKKALSKLDRRKK